MRMIPRILSADDDKEILESHRHIMERYGFEVCPAENLEKMQEQIVANGIDCVHLDILFDPCASQPDWGKSNGISELCKVLQERNGIPVIVVSGYIDAQAKQHAKECGLSKSIYGWYSKPVDYDLIAFDTIKAINESKFKSLNSRIIGYIGKLEDGDHKILKQALSTIPVVDREIKLKPELLLTKIDNLATDILVNFKSKDISNFKELIVNHLYDYYEEQGGRHLALAEHLVSSMSLLKNDSLLSSNIENLLEVFKILEKEVLTEDEIYEAKITLEDTLQINLGIGMNSDEADAYISHSKNQVS